MESWTWQAQPKEKVRKNQVKTLNSKFNIWQLPNDLECSIESHNVDAHSMSSKAHCDLEGMYNHARSDEQTP